MGVTHVRHRLTDITNQLWHFFSTEPRSGFSILLTSLLQAATTSQLNLALERNPIYQFWIRRLQSKHVITNKRIKYSLLFFFSSFPIKPGESDALSLSKAETSSREIAEGLQREKYRTASFCPKIYNHLLLPLTKFSPCCAVESPKPKSRSC